jgi:hypothetical protein
MASSGGEEIEKWRVKIRERLPSDLVEEPA